MRQGIESGLFAPHETLPTEHELQEFFGLSRTPIRQAIAKLTTDGLVDRRRSQGTVVLPRLFEEDLRTLKSFTEESTGKGLKPSAQLISFEIQPADQDDISNLSLTDSAQVYHIQRVRYIDDEPVGEWISHIPVEVAPNLNASDFSETGPTQSMYHVLEKVHGIKLVRANETFRAVNLNPESAKLLKIPAYSAVLMRTRVTFDPSGRPVALEQGLYHGLYRLGWEGREISSVDTTGTVIS